ncbi:MAG: hypothetical protein WCI50_02140 [Actinomycetes bacterium]
MPTILDLGERVLAARASPPTPTIVAMAGPVSVGKSTLADGLAAALRGLGLLAEVVSTDGFLLSTAVLVERGLFWRKGFPESYDTDALLDFLDAVRAAPEGLAVPGYSHVTYDVLPEPVRALGPLDVLVLEGVNALSATRGSVDLSVYVHAAADLVEAWYVERFRSLATDPPPGSFFERFVGLGPEGLDDVAHQTWVAVNLPNQREHIGPSRRFADVVVEKAAEHRIARIIDAGAP